MGDNTGVGDGDDFWGKLLIPRNDNQGVVTPSKVHTMQLQQSHYIWKCNTPTLRNTGKLYMSKYKNKYHKSIKTSS